MNLFSDKFFSTSLESMERLHIVKICSNLVSFLPHPSMEKVWKGTGLVWKHFKFFV